MLFDYSLDMPLAALLTALAGSLLAAPEPGDPLNAELAALLYADNSAGGGAARYELAVRRAVAQHAMLSADVLATAITAAGAGAVVRVDLARGGGGWRR